MPQRWERGPGEWRRCKGGYRDKTGIQEENRYRDGAQDGEGGQKGASQGWSTGWGGRAKGGKSGWPPVE
eukprot:362020-Chlamydomonas_euryale.AAC.3